MKRIYLDTDRCVGCGACSVACMDQNDLYPENGDQSLRWICQTEQTGGVIQYSSMACRHCDDSPCATVCAVGAIARDVYTDSIIVNRDACIGCRRCAEACPFGVPRYDKHGKMQKCGLCPERVAEGLEPACLAVCPMRALRFE